MAAGRSSTGISPRPMLMGAPRNALRAFNAGVSYTGASAPAAGWNSLAADGSGGVKVVSAGGKSYLAVEVDTTAKTVTIVL